MGKLPAILFIFFFGFAVNIIHYNPSAAQSNDQESVQSSNTKPQFGLKLGVNSFKVKAEVSSGFFGNFSGTSGSKLGLFGGLTIDIPISRRSSIQTELLYVQRGISSDGFIEDNFDFDDDDFEDESITYHYVDIPVLLKFNFDTDRNVVPSIYAGPYAGYRFRISSSTGEQIDDEADDFIRTINAGIIFGGSIGFEKFTIDLRYDLGLRNLTDIDSLLDDVGDTNGEFDDLFDLLLGDLEASQKFRGFSIGISFNF